MKVCSERRGQEGSGGVRRGQEGSGDLMEFHNKTDSEIDAALFFHRGVGVPEKHRTNMEDDERKRKLNIYIDYSVLNIPFHRCGK